jgi:hypothetical protein
LTKFAFCGIIKVQGRENETAPEKANGRSPSFPHYCEREKVEGVAFGQGNFLALLAKVVGFRADKFRKGPGS